MRTGIRKGNDGLVGRRNKGPSRANDCDAKGKLISKEREIKERGKEELKDKGEKENRRWQTEGSREQASFISS